jgi:hypothetical protein
VESQYELTVLTEVFSFLFYVLDMNGFMWRLRNDDSNTYKLRNMGFEGLTVVTMKSTVFGIWRRDAKLSKDRTASIFRSKWKSSKHKNVFLA